MLRNNMGLAWLSAEKHSSPYGTANKPRRVCVRAVYVYIYPSSRWRGAGAKGEWASKEEDGDEHEGERREESSPM